VHEPTQEREIFLSFKVKKLFFFLLDSLTTPRRKEFKRSIPWRGKVGKASNLFVQKKELWSKPTKPKCLRKNPPGFKDKFVVFYSVCRVSQKDYRYGL